MARTEKNTVKTGKNGNGHKANGEPVKPVEEKKVKPEKLEDTGTMGGATLIPMTDIFVDWKYNVSRTFLDSAHQEESLKREFEGDAFKSLMATIKSQGLLVPVIVTSQDVPGRKEPYRLVAGYRRYEACKRLNYNRIAAVVKQAESRLLDAMNIIENIEREDITPFQRAKVAVDQMAKHNLTNTDVARLMGKTDTYIANLTRCFRNLHPDILRAWADRNLKGRNDEPLNGAIFRATTTDRLNNYAGIADQKEQLRQFRRNYWIAMGKSEEEADTLCQSEGFTFPTEDKGAKGAKGPAKRPSINTLKKAIAAIEKDNDMDEENQACFIAALKFAAGIKATVSVMSDVYYDPRKEEKEAKA